MNNKKEEKDEKKENVNDNSLNVLFYSVHCVGQ